MPRKKKPAVAGKWVFVPDSQEEQEQALRDRVETSLFSNLPAAFPDRCRALEQYWDYFPQDVGNALPADGGWILVIEPPATEIIVPPFSFWFAEPWPMDGGPQRVKIVTPEGELGLFPREYRLIAEPERYYAFVGNGITLHFFGGATQGVPEEALFYLRSRGIAKRDALGMLIKNIKAHGVLWMECDEAIRRVFCRPAGDDR